jgi:hypothetical protein
MFKCTIINNHYPKFELFINILLKFVFCFSVCFYINSTKINFKILGTVNYSENDKELKL